MAYSDWTVVGAYNLDNLSFVNGPFSLDGDSSFSMKTASLVTMPAGVELCFRKEDTVQGGKVGRIAPWNQFLFGEDVSGTIYVQKNGGDIYELTHYFEDDEGYHWYRFLVLMFNVYKNLSFHIFEWDWTNSRWIKKTTSTNMEINAAVLDKFNLKVTAPYLHLDDVVIWQRHI